MVEMAVTILVLGMLFAIGIPTFRTMSQTYALKGATEGLASRLRLYRDRAINSGRAQHFHFTPGFGWDYFAYYSHSPDSLQGAWRFPPGITYSSLGTTLFWTDMLPNGRSAVSGQIVLRDRAGKRDTVSVQLSGLVLTK
jgi:type II secretory pathway pseudopilin PulG